MMQYWHSQVTKDHNSYRILMTLLDVLTEEYCKAIEHRKEFKIALSHKLEFEAFFQEREPQFATKLAESTGQITISETQSRMLRTEIIQQANLLEIVAASYANHVCDRTMIEQEFYYVFFNGHKFAFGTFIDATDRYPALKYVRSEFLKLKGPPEFHEKIT